MPCVKKRINKQQKLVEKCAPPSDKVHILVRINRFHILIVCHLKMRIRKIARLIRLGALFIINVFLWNNVILRTTSVTRLSFLFA